MTAGIPTTGSAPEDGSARAVTDVVTAVRDGIMREGATHRANGFRRTTS